MKILSLLSALMCSSVATAQLVYEGGEGPGKGKHIVFLASDHEYRSEEACPALARILSKHHGFRCTVVFGIDGKGHIQAGSSNLPGIEALKDADLFFVFARFLHPSVEQMQPIIDYLERGGPVLGLRTSSHAFQIKGNSPIAKYSYDSKVAGYEKGFGHQVLGNTWIGHYGENHKQATRIQLVESQKSHPILRGVKDGAYVYAGAYEAIAGADFTVIANSQPMVSMDPKADLDATRPPMPCTWTREYTSPSGKKGRVFHSTQGASQDMLDDNYRRMVLNGVFWTLSMEKDIKPDLNINFVGPYQPTNFSFHGEAKNVKPSDLQDLASPIMPKK